MQNRVSDIIEERDWPSDRPQPIGEILEELLIQYQRRFPDISVVVVETAATAV
jgi:hypothetical protein